MPLAVLGADDVFRRLSKSDFEANAERFRGTQVIIDDEKPFVYIPKYKLPVPRNRAERRKLLQRARSASC